MVTYVLISLMCTAQHTEGFCLVDGSVYLSCLLKDSSVSYSECTVHIYLHSEH